MAWNGVKTVVAGDPILIEDHNTYINDNLLYLLAPNRVYVKNTSATDFTTTSTSYVSVDATLSVSLTTYGGHVLIGTTFNCDLTAGTFPFFAFDVDGTQHLVWQPDVNPTPGSPDYRGRNMMVVLLPSSVIAAGAHTIALKWKVGSGTLTIYNDASNTFFWAVEI